MDSQSKQASRSKVQPLRRLGWCLATAGACKRCLDAAPAAATPSQQGACRACASHTTLTQVTVDEVLLVIQHLQALHGRMVGCLPAVGRGRYVGRLLSGCKRLQLLRAPVDLSYQHVNLTHPVEFLAGRLAHQAARQLGQAAEPSTERSAALRLAAERRSDAASCQSGCLRRDAPSDLLPARGRGRGAAPALAGIAGTVSRASRLGRVHQEAGTPPRRRLGRALPGQHAQHKEGTLPKVSSIPFISPSSRLLLTL